MKVYIGPYKNWIGPYQIAEKIFFWVDQSAYRKDDDPRVNRWDYRAADSFGGWLADTWVSSFCSWLNDKRGDQKIKVHIDKYDTWDMNYTLALIILPMLVQLKNSKHGAPWVDDEDVPEHLRSTNSPPKKNDYDVDELHFDRWDWVLDEMIWTFSQYADPFAEDQFYSGTSNLRSEKVEDTFKVDHEAKKVWYDRMKNGTRLFGKYYSSLWD